MIRLTHLGTIALMMTTLFNLFGCTNPGPGPVPQPKPPTSACNEIKMNTVSGAVAGASLIGSDDAPHMPGEVADFVAGEIVVKLKPTATAASVSAHERPLKLKSLGGSNVPIRSIENQDNLGAGVRIYRLGGVAAAAGTSVKTLKEATLEAIEQLKKRPDVEFAHPNYKVKMFISGPNDSCYQEGLQWSLRNQEDEISGINMPKAWSVWPNGGHSVTVAIIDTGIVSKHPDINWSHVREGYNFVKAEPSGRGPGAVDQGNGTGFHGTHVASVIGAVSYNNGLGMAGINPDVDILPVKVLGQDGSGELTDIVAGLRWAAGFSPEDDIRQGPPRASIVNMSLGGGVSCAQVQLLQSAINEAVKAGVLIIVAAGNEGIDAKNTFPASCENVLTVAASGRDGKLAPYSNYGTGVDILAPGGNQNTGTKNGILGAIDRNGFAYYQGTSMAAPHVAGVAAFLKSRDTSLTPAQLERKIKGGATKLSQAQCAKPCGVGLLNGNL